MKRRHNTEQIIKILREAETTDPEQVWRAHGISKQTFHRWKEKYGGLDVTEVRRMRELERENAGLKRLVAEQALVNQTTQEILKKRGWA